MKPTRKDNIISPTSDKLDQPIRFEWFWAIVVVMYVWVVNKFRADID